MFTAPGLNAAGFYGLTDNVAGLPTADYFDPERHARELKQIWYRNWIYVGRSSEVEQSRAFRTFEIGDQRILLVRDAAGVLRGFYNTCRHRGALLCREAQGQLRSSLIVCPYHAWSYGLDGALLRTSSKSEAQGFDLKDYPLYPIGVTEWNGCVFVALAPDPPPLAKNLDQPLNRLDDWPMAQLVVGHVLTQTMQCNWKIFWENYNECLHCPGVHPELSKLVPIFGRALLEEQDDPDWKRHAADEDPKFKGGLRRGATTWSTSGKGVGHEFPDLTDADRKRGHVYVTSLPSMFVVGHVDYMRVVRLRPLAPEQTELRVEYLFAPSTLADPRFDLHDLVDFSNRVMSEDAEVCELNQRGLHAAPHARGVLMPEEYMLKEFHDWVRRELARNGHP